MLAKKYQLSLILYRIWHTRTTPIGASVVEVFYGFNSFNGFRRKRFIIVISINIVLMSFLTLNTSSTIYSSLIECFIFNFEHVYSSLIECFIFNFEHVFADWLKLLRKYLLKVNNNETQVTFIEVILVSPWMTLIM